MPKYYATRDINMGQFAAGAEITGLGEADIETLVKCGAAVAEAPAAETVESEPVEQPADEPAVAEAPAAGGKTGKRKG